MEIISKVELKIQTAGLSRCEYEWWRAEDSITNNHQLSHPLLSHESNPNHI